MRKERKLNLLEKDIQDSIAAYTSTVEKWISESEVPLSLYDYSTKEVGVRVCIADGDIIRNFLFDMVKFDKITASIMVHQLHGEPESISEWTPISTLVDNIMKIYRSIYWLDKDDLIVVDGDTHSGTANLVYSFSSQALYFIHEDGHIVDVEWYNGGIDTFIGCQGVFAVHKYDWSTAMREIDEHEEEYDDECRERYS